MLTTSVPASASDVHFIGLHVHASYFAQDHYQPLRNSVFFFQKILSDLFSLMLILRTKTCRKSYTKQ